MDDARAEYYATQMKTLARIAAALERQNDLLERISGHLVPLSGCVDNEGRLWVVTVNAMDTR